MARPIQLAASVRIACTALALGLLSACLSDVDTSSENSFPQSDGTGSGFSESSSGDACRTSNLEGNEVRVSVQVPEGRASGEPGRRNLVTTSDATLEVGRSGSTVTSFTRLDSRVEEDGNGFIVSFPGRSDVPRDLDVLVRAHVGNDTWYAPVASACRHVRVNPFSDYLARSVFDSLTATERNRIESCDREPCLRTLVWPSLVDQIQNFEIDIPSNRSAASARSLLDNRADFTRFVDQALTSMLLDNTGSVAESEASVTDFNSVYFGAELNRDQDGNPFWAARSMDRGFSTNSAGTAFAYPRMTLTSFAFELIDIDVTSFDSDIPYQRNSGGVSGLDAPLNTHATQPGPAFTQGDDYLMGPRPVYQSITRPGSQTIGWAPDPWFMKSRIKGSRNDASALLTSYFHAGKAIELEESSGSAERRQTLETIGTASLEINLGRHAEETQTPTLHNEYNQIALELAPSDAGTVVRAKYGTWSFSGSSMEANEDYWRLNLSSGAMDFSAPTQDGIEITPVDYLSATDSSPDYRGHLFLNYDSANTDRGYTDTSGQAPRTPNGAVSPDGNLMAFSTRPAGRGYGIQVAGRAADDLDDVDLIGSYAVQGFSVHPEALNQYQDACLQIGSTSVEFIPAGISVSAMDNDSGAPEAIAAEPVLFNSTPQRTNGQYAVEDGDNSLGGFLIDEGETLVLTKKTSQSLGILLAFRQSDDPESCQ